MLQSAAGNILMLRRRDTGEWAYPGGHIEAGETAEEAAEREAEEEIGPVSYGSLSEWTRRIKADPALDGGLRDAVDFTTFRADVEAEFVPTLNEEHTAWTWANPAQPPEPLHPGAAAALARLTMDELGVARSIVAGELASPQRYENMWLFALRITGTGAAYRPSLEEFCWREPANYLNDEFVARCNGLPVIWVHPPTASLNSEEFARRIIGTVMLPYIKGDEVWGVCRIYDDDAIERMTSDQLSTSPGVVLRDADNLKLETEDGRVLLIEGAPKLVDHVAVVDRGVWDKGGPATGVSMTPQEPTMAEENPTDNRNDADDEKLKRIADALDRMDAKVTAMEDARKDAETAAEREKTEREDRARKDANRKDRFSARKDGEAFADYRARHDADEDAEADEREEEHKDRARARADARRARRDAETAERRADESFAEWAKEEGDEPEHKKDAKRRDESEAEHEEHKEEADKEPRGKEGRFDARADSLLAENKKMQALIRDLQSKVSIITAETTAEDRNALAAAQARADSVAGLFGSRAPAPVPGEKPLDYRRRLAGEFKKHSERFKGKSFAAMDADVLGMVEDTVYADAANAAHSPSRGGAGVLIPIIETDMAGRKITKWAGDGMAWRQHFMTGAQVGRIRQAKEVRG